MTCPKTGEGQMITRRSIATSLAAACGVAIVPKWARGQSSGRMFLTQPTTFYCGSGGSLGNDGLSPGTALPTTQDVVSRLQQKYDLGGQQVIVQILNGSVDPGFQIFGPMVGQAGAG